MAPEVVALMFTTALAMASTVVAVWSSVQLRRLRDARERETHRRLDEAYAALRIPIGFYHEPAHILPLFPGIEPHAEQEVSQAVREVATAVAAYQSASMVGLSSAVEALIRARSDQAWYWTPEWQAKEREADSAIAAGRLVGPMDEQQFDEWLDQLDAWAGPEVKASS